MRQPAAGVQEEGAPVFNRIVVGTDGSDTASVAVEHAVALAKATGASLDVVTAYERPAGEGVSPEERVEVPGDVRYELSPRQEVYLVLDRAAGEAERAGIEAHTHAREGDPADALLDVAEETKADLVIVGSKGMAGARRFLLGSVPNKVSHHALCGVYIVRTT
jgi:nucleotide-binding universal stress UspA family protein